jgi:hypothetical protein
VRKGTVLHDLDCSAFKPPVAQPAAATLDARAAAVL